MGLLVCLSVLKNLAIQGERFPVFSNLASLPLMSRRDCCLKVRCVSRVLVVYKILQF